MITLKREQFIKALDEYLAGRTPFARIRSFVFERYGSDDEVIVADDVDDLFAVLTPYLLHEEAYGDPSLSERMKRLRAVLNSTSATKERVIFAIEFSEIMALTKKLELGVISQTVYEEQLSRLSPVEFDVKRVALWAGAHSRQKDLTVARMS